MLAELELVQREELIWADYCDWVNHYSHCSLRLSSWPWLCSDTHSPPASGYQTHTENLPGHQVAAVVVAVVVEEVQQELQVV